MDIGEVERIGDREMPGLPKFPNTLPAKPPVTTPAPTPAKTPEKEKTPA
jgi:hypothetical protein